jgi:hypothetical protein
MGDSVAAQQSKSHGSDILTGWNVPKGRDLLREKTVIFEPALTQRQKGVGIRG